MNFQVIILLSVAVCALSLPRPDEEVSALLKNAGTLVESVTPVGELTKSPTSPSTVEETNAVAGNVTVENVSKTETDSELGKPTESAIETTSIAEDEIKEVPKSMPVVAREETQPIVPPFAGVRAEPKEGVEIVEAKSTDSSPDTEETDSESEPKPTAETQPSTESSISGSVAKKDETSTTEEKPKSEGTESKSSTKPPVAGENKTEDATTTATKKADKSNPKSKSTETVKEKHDHSSEGNKSEESAESKESEESEESNKSK